MKNFTNFTNFNSSSIGDKVILENKIEVSSANELMDNSATSDARSMHRNIFDSDKTT